MRLAATAFEESLANTKMGLPPVSIEIIGHSNGTQDRFPNYGFAKEHGLERANEVANLFRRFLSSYAKDQESSFDPDHINITVRSGGADLPDGSSHDENPYTARRRVVIWVSEPVVIDPSAAEHDQAAGDSTTAHRPSQEEIETENEIQRLKDEIHEEFGITLDSEKGARAGVEKHGTTDPGVIAAIQPAPWTVNKVKHIITALKHYKPILGKERDTSSRSGIEQEVNTIGNITWLVNFGNTNEIESRAEAEYLQGFATFNMSTYAWNPGNIQHVVTHELAHGLLKYAEPQFDDKFWMGHRTPSADTPEMDFENAIATYFSDPEGLRKHAPHYAEAMAELAAHEPSAMVLHPDEDVEVAASEIAYVLHMHLPWFMERVGTWSKDGKPQTFFPRERPITKYGEKDSGEDLAETAAVYFTDIERLRSGAPLRAEFM
ncbi:hypothetical protein, partial [Streptomyces sp. NPDC094468]|uniref:hypothetical protein n=1 Tax=Streptomyces sp. NPDC094468 TaxID=3366066 RepID=UPI003813812D